ncbi:MAG TPA: PAS domain S-box protein, partial [Chitinophagaceae bacterium]|nr:PAS domain S-box protein [Chitinophagaceae bacterium]
EILFGYTTAEVMGRHISLLTPPGRGNEEQTIIEKIREGNSIQHYETERIRKDGSTIHVSLSVSPLKDSRGHIFGASNIGRNITERKMAEENLRKTLKELSDYKYALDESCIVAITDQKGIIKYVNDKFCKISKYTEKELLGRDHRIINSGYHPTEFIRRLWTTIANGNIWRGEIKNKAKDGSYYWVDTTIVPFLNEQGKPYQYVAIRADITERKNAEHNIKELNETLEKKVTERTIQLEAVNKELEAFTYSVSHDLRAPLRIIDGYANILVDDYTIPLDKEGNRLLGIIMSNARRMGDLIDDLLNLSRLGRKDLSVQKINMQDLVVPVISELLSINACHPEITTGPLEPADCDSSLIRQVWGNLISNAIKYSGTREKPSIEINSYK